MLRPKKNNLSVDKALELTGLVDGVIIGGGWRYIQKDCCFFTTIASQILFHFSSILFLKYTTVKNPTYSRTAQI